MIDVFEAFAGYGYINSFAGYCGMVNQYTRKEIISKEELEKLYLVKNMTYKEVAEEIGFSVKVIQNRMKKYDITPRKAIKRNQFKSNNHAWKGGRTINKTTGYVYIKNRNHIRSNSKKYVFEHILVMEKKIKRHLKHYSFNNSKNEVVHHKDGNKENNIISNLQLMTFGEHISLHSKGKRYKNGKRQN